MYVLMSDSQGGSRQGLDQEAKYKPRLSLVFESQRNLNGKKSSTGPIPIVDLLKSVSLSFQSLIPCHHDHVYPYFFTSVLSSLRDASTTPLVDYDSLHLVKTKDKFKRVAADLQLDYPADSSKLPAIESELAIDAYTNEEM